LCPVSRPLTALDWVLLKDRSLALVLRLGPEINSWACLWVLPRPSCPVLVDQPTTEPSLYFLSRDSQDRLRSKESPARAVPCKLIGDLVASYSSMSRDPVQPHCVPGRDVIQRPLALLDQRWRCYDGLKSLQGRLAIRANTHVFLWSIQRLNLLSTGQDSIYLGLENCSLFA
jgi:hypothetical protein